jgi:ABC-type molybdate transport system permease subunit
MLQSGSNRKKREKVHRTVVSCLLVVSEFVTFVKSVYEFGYTIHCVGNLPGGNTCVSTFEFRAVHMNTGSTGK